jgi:hypothetical protein
MPTAAVWEKKEAIMQKSISKKLFALVLAVMMSVSVFAVSASAASPGVGVYPNTQLWFEDTAFTSEYPQILDIDDGSEVEPWDFTLGDNTIQKFVQDGSDYVITTHPQYFGTTYNYDDEANAQYVMNIRNILVYNPTNGRYEEGGHDGGFYIFPTASKQYNAEHEPYLECLVYSSIINIETEEVIDAAWNGDTIYLKIALDN